MVFFIHLLGLLGKWARYIHLLSKYLKKLPVFTEIAPTSHIKYHLNNIMLCSLKMQSILGS